MTTITRRLAEAALLAMLCSPAAALELALPGGARLMGERISDPGSYAVPTGPWQDETGIPVIRSEGRILRQAWRIPSPDLTTLQVLAPLREQLEAKGYEIVFDCASARCGGFDFRFGTEVIPAPEMYVDLTAFRFLSARGPGGDHVTLLVSRSNAASYVQVIQSGGGGQTDAPTPPENPPPAAVQVADVADFELEAKGHMILRDLRFESGSASLGDDAVASLDAIAAYLAKTPDRRVLFVGHTDATGSLEANIAVSRARADAAMDYVRGKGVAAAQLGSEGAGYLAPVASNLTEVGREENRRVEAILLPTE
ncbi:MULTISPECIES: OmpA family protein [Salipiger]|uniref:OmpA family protein n=1 Tax=Salipiger TaxID=263377 RepID=UPI0035137674